MKAFKIVLLVLISILLVLGLWGFMANMAVERTALSSAYYRNLMERVDLASSVHSELQEVLPELIKEGVKEGNEDEGDEVPEELEEMLTMISGAFLRAYDEEWLEENLLIVTEDFLGLIKGEQDSLSAVINLKDGKDSLRDELAIELEGMTEEQLKEMDLPSGDIEEITDKIVTEIDIPDELVLGEMFFEDGMDPEAEKVLASMQTARTLLLILPYVIFVLLLVFCCLLAGIAGGLKWYGAAALFSGVTFTFGLLLMRSIFLTRALNSLFEEMPLNPGPFQEALSYTILRAVTVPLVISGLALALLIAGFIFGKMKQRKAS